MIALVTSWILILREIFRRPSPAFPQREPELLVDVSCIVVNDARTGIQRVVRAIASGLLSSQYSKRRVRLVVATKYCPFRYLENGIGGLIDSPKFGDFVNPSADDVFLGLDLNMHILPRYKVLFWRWKRRGMQIQILIYDLLPRANPQWFSFRVVDRFATWLNFTVHHADGIITISNKVANELKPILAAKGLGVPVRTIRLGADIKTTLPSTGLNVPDQKLLSYIQKAQALLMVGTIEPRKGHVAILKAMELLWSGGYPYLLIIAGKPGWKTEAFQVQLRNHAENQKRLFWFENISDDGLALLYRYCIGTVQASYDEGFGLPIVESLSYGRPVLARDTVVFREIANTGTSFFGDDAAPSLAKDIVQFINYPPKVDKNRLANWSKTIDTLAYIIE